MENFIFCAVLILTILQCFRNLNIYKNISVSASLWRQTIKIDLIFLASFP